MVTATVTVRRLGRNDWKPAREIRLRALRDAPGAFYRKSGFAATGRAETFGDDGRRLAALMTMPLTPAPAASGPAGSWPPASGRG